MALKFYTTSEEAWNAELEEIKKSVRTIDIESYIFLFDGIGKRFLELLAEKAKKGVRVRCIFDAFGSGKTAKQIIKWCKENGIDAELFHKFFVNSPEAPFWKRVLQRTHKKTFIIDGKTAFMGGVNIIEEHKNWRDIQAKIEGANVIPLQETFDKTWNYLKGNYLKRVKVRVGERLEKIGKKLSVEILDHDPDQESTSFKKLFKYLTKTAEKEIVLITPYFFPSPTILKYMRDAVQKGVKVKLLAPWTMEVKWAVPLMREYLRSAADLGVEFRDAGEPLLHAKAILVDGQRGIVGSANLNQRSFVFDRELSVIIKDKKNIAELEKIISEWWEAGKPMAENQKKRTGKEWFAGIPARILKKFI